MSEEPTIDPMGATLGVELVRAGGGEAEMALTITDDHCNGHGMCHGGVMFLLADTVMDYATNTGEPLSVAVHAEMDYVSPAYPGDRLVATGKVTDRWGRTALLDASVVNESTGKLVAHFRGRTRAVAR